MVVKNPPRLVLGLLLVAVIVVSGCTQTPTPGGAATPLALSSPSPVGKMVIAIQPTETAAEVAPRARQMEEFLEKRMGGDVEILVPTTYAAVIEALRFGQAHAGLMSAWPAALASQKAGAEIVLAEVREVVIGEQKQEKPYYFSYWVVPRGSPAQSLAELRGKRACFASPLSTSGFVMPVARLVELGLVPRPPQGKEADPKAFFGETIFGGGYAQCWSALKGGQVDVSIIAGDVSEKLYREVLDGTRVLEQQGPIPSHAVVFGKGLPEPQKSRLRQALLDLGASENRDLMRKLLSGIFVRFENTTTPEHIAPLSRALELTGQEFLEKVPGRIQEVVTIHLGDDYIAARDGTRGGPFRVVANRTVGFHIVNTGTKLHEVAFGRGAKYAEQTVEGKKKTVPDGYNLSLFEDLPADVFIYKPEKIEVATGGRLEEMEVGPGGDLWVRAVFPPEAKGEWEIGCFVPGHYEEGMRARLIVE
ncbi:MAG: phosphate/phosphite/phosphonate ABC transporter substrate-binding protein [Euryarchaeota archaeon]|nr:phosphate/phosphite/phosphonate ABC transporter substrate-binding protein [Euryarchaeota archaeon]